MKARTITSCLLSAVLFAGGLTILRAWQMQAPMTLDELKQTLRMPEAEKPSEEIVAEIEKRFAGFEMSEEISKQLEGAARESRRPTDLVLRVIRAAQSHSVWDRIKLLAGSEDGLRTIGDLVRKRDVSIPYSTAREKQLWQASQSENAITTVWPPTEPPKPRFADQLWRSPVGMIKDPDLLYNPLALTGTVTLDMVVDGRVMFLAKHGSLFYNVMCSRDVEFQSVQFSQPIPRVGLEEIDYTIQLTEKVRGFVYPCPQDPRCAKADEDVKKDASEQLCSWRDLTEPRDERGYPNVRFLVDDSRKKGSASYKFTLAWALKPYTEETFLQDLERLGPKVMANRVYKRGAFFAVTPELDAKVRALGGENRLLDEIKGNFRQRNQLPGVK